MSNYQYYEYQQNDDGYGVPPYTPEPPKAKKPKKEHKFLKTLGKTAAIGAVFGLVAGGVFQGTGYIANRALGSEETAVVEQQEEPCGDEQQEQEGDQLAQAAFSAADSTGV